MNIGVKFVENEAFFRTKFGAVQNISDGGFERGYAEGYEKGYEAGYTVGSADGYTKGETAGKAEGYQTGYHEGDIAGYSRGHSEGYEAGYTAGYEQGRADYEIATQEKTVEIVENGTVEITPDDGYALSKATVTVNVSSEVNQLDEMLDGTITEINSVVATVANYACRARTNLISVNLPNATRVGQYSFHTCTQMVSFVAPNLVNNGTYWCSENESLKEISLPKVAALANAAFSKCTALEKADFTVINRIGTSVFNGCTSLEILILRNADSVCSLSGVNSFTGTPIASGTGYIYVPAALVDSYKAATNWSTYADQIRAIEDYPEICGEVST